MKEVFGHFKIVYLKLRRTSFIIKQSQQPVYVLLHICLACFDGNVFPLFSWKKLHFTEVSWSTFNNTLFDLFPKIFYWIHGWRLSAVTSPLCYCLRTVRALQKQFVLEHCPAGTSNLDRVLISKLIIARSILKS